MNPQGETHLTPQAKHTMKQIQCIPIEHNYLQLYDHSIVTVQLVWVDLWKSCTDYVFIFACHVLQPFLKARCPQHSTELYYAVIQICTLLACLLIPYTSISNKLKNTTSTYGFLHITQTNTSMPLYKVINWPSTVNNLFTVSDEGTWTRCMQLLYCPIVGEFLYFFCVILSKLNCMRSAWAKTWVPVVLRPAEEWGHRAR